MRFLIGILAAISSLFAQEPKSQPLNAAIITFAQTYYTPVVTSPDIFPKNYDKFSKIKEAEVEAVKEEGFSEAKSDALAEAAKLSLAARILPSQAQPQTPVVPQAPVVDPYLANPEPITNWLRLWTMPDGHTLPIKGSSDQTLSGFNIDRTYWKIEVSAYWVSPNPNAKLPIVKDYFKLEVYEEGSNKLIYTMTSGIEESFFKSQSFKKPGKYYLKIYSNPHGQYEINFYSSPTLAK